MTFFLLSILILLALTNLCWGGDIPPVSLGAVTVYVTPEI